MDRLRTLTAALGEALDPGRLMARLGMPPDPWQREVLLADEHLLLNCHRQAGKSTVIGVKAAHTAATVPGALTIILSRSQRQAAETFRKALAAYHALSAAPAVRRSSSLHLELANGSRIVSLPGKEETIRGFSGVRLLILDEAARIPDALYRAVRPMVAVSRGRIVALSTPFGQRGFFWKEWTQGRGWRRVQVTADQCPRLTAEFLAEEEQALGRTWFLQEYHGSFTAVEGLVYPDFGRAVVAPGPQPAGRKVGGIDWGWNAPFAAVWGVHDPATDRLVITGERYLRGTALSAHRAALKPLGCTWVADPAGATEIAEFRAAGLTVHKAVKDIQAGIAAVTARLQTGRLQVWNGCKHLIAEAGLYRYPSGEDGAAEKPVDAHNHALDALRYLVAHLDRRFMARARGIAAPTAAGPEAPWLRPENEALWG